MRQSELEHALRVVVEGNYECALCYMRYYFKSPVWELTPTDDRNMVPAIYTCREECVVQRSAAVRVLVVLTVADLLEQL